MQGRCRPCLLALKQQKGKAGFLALLATNFPAHSLVLRSKGSRASKPPVPRRGGPRVASFLLAGPGPVQSPRRPWMHPRAPSALASPHYTTSLGSRGRPPPPAPATPDSAARPQIWGTGGGRTGGASAWPLPAPSQSRRGAGGSGEIGTRALNEGEQMSLCCWEAWVACCSGGDRGGADLPGPLSVSVQMARPPPCPLLRVGTAAAGGSAAGGSRLRGGAERGPEGIGPAGRAGPAHKGAPAAAPRRTMQPRGAGGCAWPAAALQLPLHNEACKRAHLILNPLRRSPCEPGRGWPSDPLQSQAWSPGAQPACAPRMQIESASRRNRQSFCIVTSLVQTP